MDFSFLAKYWPYFTDGVVVTLFISVITVACGVILGTLLAFMKISKWAIFRWPANIYIAIFRGTPMYLQILMGWVFFYNVLRVPEFYVMNAELKLLVSGMIPLAMNSAAYVAEIVRGGIQGVNKGQMEAAYSLGLRPVKTMFHVILPQAIKNILPALGNEFVTVIKDSSLLSAIGVSELTFGADSVKNITFRGLEPLLIAAVIYFILTFITSGLLGLWEKKLSKGYAK